MAACRNCNIHKGSLDLEGFRNKISSQIEQLNTLKKNSDYRLAKSYGLVTEKQKPVIFYFEQI